MKTGDISRKEIEEKLQGVGDYVAMEYLNKFLEKPIDIETRRYVAMKLARLHEARKMLFEAGKLYRYLAELEVNNSMKIADLLKAGDLLIKSGKGEEADMIFKRALGFVTRKEEEIRIKEARKQFYKAQAKEYLARGKRKHAMEMYEKLKEMRPNIIEEQEINEILLELYQKLGKVREYMLLKRR